VICVLTIVHSCHDVNVIKVFVEMCMIIKVNWSNQGCSYRGMFYMPYNRAGQNFVERLLLPLALHTKRYNLMYKGQLRLINRINC